MKKLLLIAMLLVAASCQGGVTYKAKVRPGDIRKTYTREYVITEVCRGENAFGHLFWDKVSIEKISIEDKERMGF